ncbi:class I SAM-dependent methyltransferase [Heyndrickxia camelliae]|nr:class I SAM-dependent methyltransferase [Heyndrickxia camelliae]
MNYFQLLSELAKRLDNEDIPYQFVESTSLWIQGVELDPLNEVFLEVQWDVLEKIYALFPYESISELKRNQVFASYQAKYNGYTLYFQCFFNTTIRTNPYRVEIVKDNTSFWCISFYHYLYNGNHAVETRLISEFLKKQQQAMTIHNEEAWNQHNYEALLNRHGDPAVVAEKVKQNPSWRLHPFYKYFSHLSGKKVMHVMGSNGIKGVALSLLGAQVTIVDFSKENQAFAREVASAAKVSLDYIVSDILSLHIEEHKEKYDYVLMELGVLHYFIDLFPLAEIISNLLRKDGKFILHEFHPISTKLITSSGKKHKVTGNYFDPALFKREVAFSKHMPQEINEGTEEVLQRKWTLGELITTIGQSGMLIEVLEEEPNHKIHDIGLPKTFTLVARKI